MSRTGAVTLLLLAAAGLLFWALQRSMADAVLAFGAHPEVVEALESSLDDQKELARLDEAEAARHRQRFDEVEELLLRLRVLELNRRQILRRYEILLLAIFLVSAALSVGYLAWRQRRQEPRLARLQAALTGLAAGAGEVPAPDHGRDAIGRIAAMIEQTSRRMAADRRRLAALQGLSAWQATARQQVHELRTPLTAARLALDRLEAALGGDAGEALDRAAPQGPSPGGGAAAAVVDLRGELGRLAEQARRLADFARLPPPQPRRWDLGRLARDTLHTYRDVWRGTELVAAGDGDVAVEVDRDLLRQVLVNLCENAAQAGARRVELRWGRRGTGGAGRGKPGGAWLTVADDGPGVPEALAERVFEPYVSGRGDGSGLGLAICRKILLDNGGDLELQRGAGSQGSEARGAVFRLTFPAAAPAAAEPA